MRQRSINRYGFVDQINLQDIHLIFDNLCNLKCRMCSSDSSHLLIKEELMLYGQTFSNQKYSQNTLYQNLDLSNIKRINITGDEPLLSPHFNKFLKKLNEETNLNEIEFCFFSNGTILPSTKLLESFNQFKKSKLQLVLTQ